MKSKIKKLLAIILSVVALSFNVMAVKKTTRAAKTKSNYQTMGTTYSKRIYQNCFLIYLYMILHNKNLKLSYKNKLVNEINHTMENVDTVSLELDFPLPKLGFRFNNQMMRYLSNTFSYVDFQISKKNKKNFCYKYDFITYIYNKQNCHKYTNCYINSIGKSFYNNFINYRQTHNRCICISFNEVLYKINDPIRNYFLLEKPVPLPDTQYNFAQTFI